MLEHPRVVLRDHAREDGAMLLVVSQILDLLDGSGNSGEPLLWEYGKLVRTVVGANSEVVNWWNHLHAIAHDTNLVASWHRSTFQPIWTMEPRGKLPPVSVKQSASSTIGLIVTNIWAIHRY